MFGNIIDIVKAHNPKVILLENVAHFVRHDAGETYKKVQIALESAGYSIVHKQLSPHQFSVPHIRQRIYLLATKKPLSPAFEWPKPHESVSLDIQNILDTEPKDAVAISARVDACLELWQEFLTLIPSTVKLPSFPLWSMEAHASYPISRQNLASFSAEKLGAFKGSFGVPLADIPKSEQMRLVPAYARGKGEVFPKWKRDFITQNRVFWNEHASRLKKWLPKVQMFPPSLQKFEWNCQGETRDIRKFIVQFRASGVRVKRRTTAPSLVAMTSSQIPIIPWENRYMTVKECARLQSMDALKHLPTGVVAMSSLGNAVNVRVVAHILKGIIDSKQLVE